MRHKISYKIWYFSIPSEKKRFSPESQESSVKLGRVQTVPGAGVEQLAVTRQVLVVAGVEGVVASLGLAARVDVLALAAELQGEEGVLAPGHRGVHVDLVLRGAQVGKALAAG